MPIVDPAEPAVGWAYACLPLLVLAVNSMCQPSGRLLGASITYSTVLRASPILCTLDALVLVVRCITYCGVRRVGLRRALLMSCHDRFDMRAVADDKNGTNYQPAVTLATTLKMPAASMARLGVVSAGIVWLVSLAMMPGGGGARWTAVWGWLYVCSYVPTELALQAYAWDTWHRHHSRPNEMEYIRLAVKSRYAAMTKTDEKEDNSIDGINDINDINEKDDKYDADDNGAYNDPSMDPKLDAFHKMLEKLYRMSFLAGSISQIMFVYWAFLDLVQPELNRHLLALDMLQTQDWDSMATFNPKIYYLSMPLMFVAIIVSYTIMFWYISTAGSHVIMRIFDYITDSVSRRSNSRIVRCVLFIVRHGACIVWGYFVGTQYVLLAGLPIISSKMMWMYAMLLVDLVVLVLFLAACLLFSVVVMIICDITCKPWLRRHGRLGVGYISIFLISLVISIVWYTLRFADSAHWLQNWRGALALNNTKNTLNATGIAAVQLVTLTSSV